MRPMNEERQAVLAESATTTTPAAEVVGPAPEGARRADAVNP